MNITKKWVLATVLVGSIAGGALGGPAGRPTRTPSADQVRLSPRSRTRC